VDGGDPARLPHGADQLRLPAGKRSEALLPRMQLVLLTRAQPQPGAARRAEDGRAAFRQMTRAFSRARRVPRRSAASVAMTPKKLMMRRIPMPPYFARNWAAWMATVRCCLHRIPSRSITSAAG
jgi:hypothetical protein